MGDEIFYPSIENEILMAATVLWRADVNGDRYRCFLNEADYNRLVTEFREPVKVLTFTRFTVEISPRRIQHSLMSGNMHRVDLRFPPCPIELSLVAKN
jgi:hypothetical protein